MSEASCLEACQAFIETDKSPRPLMKTISSRRFPTAEFKEAAEISNMWGPQMRKQRLERLELISPRNMFGQWLGTF